MESQLWGLVCEFVRLSWLKLARGPGGRLRGEDLKRAKEAMAGLGRCGFTSLEIAELSGGAWDDITVRGYWKYGGAVDGALEAEKTNIIGYMRTLASAGLGLEAIKLVSSVDAKAKAVGSNIEGIVDLDAELQKVPLERGDVGLMLAAARGMRGQTTAQAVIDQMDLDRRLVEKGFNENVRKRLEVLFNRFGGADKATKPMNLYFDVEAKLSEKAGLVGDIEDLEVKKKKLEDYVEVIRDVLEAKDELNRMGWNDESLIWAPFVLKWANTPEKQTRLTRHLWTLDWYVDEEGKQMLAQRRKKTIKNPIELWEYLKTIPSKPRLNDKTSAAAVINLLNEYWDRTGGLNITIWVKSYVLQYDSNETAQWLLTLEELGYKVAPKLVPK